MKPALELLLTEAEKKTRKRWLFYMLFLLGIRIVMAGVAAFGVGEKAGLLGAVGISFVFCLSFFLTYLLCYRKITTFILTLSIGVGFISLLSSLVTNFALLLAAGNSGIGILFFTLPLMALEGFYFYGLWLTIRLRRINKVLRCYEKFPMESEELVRVVRSYSELEKLTVFFKEQIKERPFLKPLLRRERDRKVKELKPPPEQKNLFA